MSCSAHLLSRLRFRHLSLLVAIDEHRNLHRAAEAVHLAQPSATKLVRDLEAVFGFPLFERLPRGMHPTELGVEVLGFARQALGDLERFARELDSRRACGEGQLLIAVSRGTTCDLVARAVADLKLRRPSLTVRIVNATPDETVGLLLDHIIDFAVEWFSNQVQCKGLEYERLGEDTLYLVARPGHPLARVRRLSFAMLSGCPWILPPSTDSARQVIERELHQLSEKLPKNVTECSSTATTVRLLQGSDAIAILAGSVVRDELGAGLLVRLNMAMGRSVMQFGTISQRGRPLGQAATEFSQLLRHHCMLRENDPREPEGSGLAVRRRGNARLVTPAEALAQQL